MPSARLTRVRRLFTRDGDTVQADVGTSPTVALDGEMDLSRGGMLVAPRSRPEVADQFAANLIWLDNENHATA